MKSRSLEAIKGWRPASLRVVEVERDRGRDADEFPRIPGSEIPSKPRSFAVSIIRVVENRWKNPNPRRVRFSPASSPVIDHRSQSIFYKTIIDTLMQDRAWAHNDISETPSVGINVIERRSLVNSSGMPIKRAAFN